MKIALLLIALGVGYKIYEDGSKNAKKSLKRLGRIIGVFIMVIAFAGTVCQTVMTVKYGMHRMGYGGSYHKWKCSQCDGYHGKKFCPLAGKSLKKE